MKSKNNTFGIASKLCSVALLAFAGMAHGQVAFDAYSQARTVVVDGPRILNGGSPAFTNNPCDISQLTGIGKIDISSCTNSGGALTATFYTSPDKTNWTALANYSLAQQASVLNTNRYYGGTNLIGTNLYNLPGAITYPTAATAGFATPYLDNSSPFTNSGAVTVTTKNVYTIGFNINDAGRYLMCVWTPTGTSSNDIVSAVLTAPLKRQFP